MNVNLSSDPLLVEGRLSIDGIVLQLQNNSNFNGDVRVYIYADRFQKDLVAKSRSLFIRERSHSFNLQEIFSVSDFKWENEKSIIVCIHVIAEKQDLPLGFTCSETTRVKQQTNNNISKKENKKDFFDANITYELEALPFSQTPTNHIIDYNGELRIKEVPIRFQGLYQKNNDPYLDYNLSHFSVFVDVDQLRRNLKNKADKIYEEKRDSLLADFPEYKSFVKRKNYVEQVLENPGALKDLEAIDSLTVFMEELELKSKSDFLAYQDSLQHVLNNREASLRDSLLSDKSEAKLDSIQQKIIKLQKQIRQVKQYAKILQKKDAYENLSALGIESDEYVRKADSVAMDLDLNYGKILEQPNKLNQYLKQHEIGAPYLFLLNHVSAFRIGNFNPGYSELVLQNSQINGLNLGLEYGKWGIGGFRGTLRNSDLNLEPDSTSIQVKVTGAKISYANGAKLKNDFFLIMGDQRETFGPAYNQTIIGHSSAYNFGKRSVMDFELAWALNGLQNSTELEAEKRDRFIKALAGRSRFSTTSKNGKLNWNAEVEYYGPQYFDFNNPFLINNSIELSNAFRYTITKGLQLGLNTLYNKGNLWETINPNRRQTLSQGINVSYFHKKWPTIQYVYNRAKIDAQDISLNSVLHNVNVSKSYKLKDIQLQSLFSTSVLENNSPVDSLDSEVFTLYLSQEIRVTKNIRVVASCNYFELSKSQNRKEFDRSYELKLPLNFNRLNIDPGIKWIKNTNTDELGWSLNASWLITDKLSLNVLMNSLWLNSAVDEFGIIRNEYTAHFSGRINYRF